MAFNVLFGNTDDHFRNHGFLLTPKGWTLSPAFDLNPSTEQHHCLLIDEYTEQSNIGALQNAHESYMLDSKEAAEIIEQVRDAVKDWRAVAAREHVATKPMEKYASRWDVC